MTFVRFLLNRRFPRMNDADKTSTALPTLQTRASLIFRLKDWKDDGTWREFYDLYYNYVYRYARGAGLGHHESEDLTHEVFQRVATNIRKFEPQPQPGSFRRWLGNQARWRVIDRIREKGKIPIAQKQRKAGESENRTDTLERIPSEHDEGLRLEEAWQKQLVETALQRIAHDVSPKHYQIFVMHHLDGWSLKKIAADLKISRASAYVVNHRLKAMLQREVKSLVEELGD